MSDLIRDAPIGQLLRWATENRILQYPEERPDFQCPNSYQRPSSPTSNHIPPPSPSTPPAEPEGPAIEEAVSPADLEPIVEKYDKSDADDDEEGEESELEKIKTAQTARTQYTARTQISRVGTRTALQKSVTRADLEQQFELAALEVGPSRPIEPEKLADGTILVDWYSTTDPENPQNWSFKKKLFVMSLIDLYTLAVYMGSAIYAPSELGIMERFGVSIQEASLGLSMYVLAYGIGPLLWSPLSEIPSIGRNPPYLVSYAIFVILLVPTALVDNFPGLIVLRFLQGFMGSPCLATGGATFQDMYSIIKLPYVLSIWAFAATCGPALGPIISGFSVQAENWRWSLWEMLWLNGPIFLLLFFFLPETGSANLLLRRAQRLRKITGDERLKAQSEIDQAQM